MSSFRTFSALTLLLLLAGCGFRPLYAPPEEDTTGKAVYAFDIFKTLAIDNIPDREGQYFRNRLVQLLHPSGRNGAAQHVLEVTLDESSTDLAVQRSAIATRANLTITARFRMRNLETGAIEEFGFAKSISGYNIFQSEFQTLMAEKGARERALDDLAQQLRVRLAALLTTAGQKQKAQ